MFGAVSSQGLGHVCITLRVTSDSKHFVILKLCTDLSCLEKHEVFAEDLRICGVREPAD